MSAVRMGVWICTERMGVGVVALLVGGLFVVNCEHLVSW